MVTKVEVPGHGIVEFPDRMTDAQIESAIKANIPSGPSKDWQKKAAESMWRAENPGKAKVADFTVGATGLMRGGVNLLGGMFGKDKLGEEVWPSNLSRDTGYKLAGTLADPVGWTIAGGAAKVLPVAKVLGQGFARGAGAVATNIAGGAATGGIIGGLSEEGTALEGAAMGAGVGLLSPIVLGAASKGIGWAVDAVKGRLADIRAGKVLRDVADKELPKIMAALKASGDDTAGQAALGVGSTKFSALAKRSELNDSQFYSQRKLIEEASREAEIAKLAAGATQTEAKQVTKASQQALGNVAIPIRNEALDQANIAGKLLPKFQDEQQRMAGMAANKVQDVRRMLTESGEDALGVKTPPGVRERALNIAHNTSKVPGQPLIPGRYTYMGEKGGIADRASQVADKSAFDSLIYGDAARFAKTQGDSLAESGLRPIDTKGILSSIQHKMDDPDLAGNEQAIKILRSVSRDIDSWATKNNGVIDAYALDAIRKNSVNSAVDKFLGTADPEVKKKAAAAAMTSLKPLFSKSIVDAGGTNYPAYLKTYEQGMQIINQQKLGAKALEMLQKDPQSFVALVQGNNPKLVQKIFTTDFDVKSAMGEKFIKMQKVANELTGDARLKELADLGGTELTGVLQKDAARLRLPPFLSAKATITNAGIDVLEAQLNKKTMAKVYNAMRNGKDAAALMETLSTRERSLVLKAVESGSLTPYFAAGAANISVQEEQQ